MCRRPIHRLIDEWTPRFTILQQYEVCGCQARDLAILNSCSTGRTHPDGFSKINFQYAAPPRRYRGFARKSGVAAKSWSQAAPVRPSLTAQRGGKAATPTSYFLKEPLTPGHRAPARSFRRVATAESFEAIQASLREALACILWC